VIDILQRERSGRFPALVPFSQSVSSAIASTEALCCQSASTAGRRTNQACVSSFLLSSPSFSVPFFYVYLLRKLNEKHHNYQERGRKPWVPGVCRCRPCPVGHGLDKPRDTPLTTRRYELLSATLANTDKTRCMSTMDPRSWDNRRWNQAAEPSSPLTTFARHHGNITYPTRHCGRHT